MHKDMTNYRELLYNGIVFGDEFKIILKSPLLSIDLPFAIKARTQHDSNILEQLQRSRFCVHIPESMHTHPRERQG